MLSRSDSFPEADFIQYSSARIQNVINNEMSEYKKKEILFELLPEPLLKEDKTRFVLFPIKQTDVRKFCTLVIQFLIYFN